jgi:hypothetical protein
MTPFARFALIFGIVVAAVCLFGCGPFAGLGLIGGTFGAIFSVFASIIGAAFALVCGLAGLFIGLVAMTPLLFALLVLLSPLILLAGLIALATRAARG